MAILAAPHLAVYGRPRRRPDEALLFSGRRLVDDDVEREIDLLVAWPGVGLRARPPPRDTRSSIS